MQGSTKLWHQGFKTCVKAAIKLVAILRTSRPFFRPHFFLKRNYELRGSIVLAVRRYTVQLAISLYLAYVKNKKTDCLAGPWATWAMGMFLNCVNPCNILLCYEIFVTNDQHTQNYCIQYMVQYIVFVLVNLSRSGPLWIQKNGTLPTEKDVKATRRRFNVGKCRYALICYTVYSIQYTVVDISST